MQVSWKLFFCINKRIYFITITEKIFILGLHATHIKLLKIYMLYCSLFLKYYLLFFFLSAKWNMPGWCLYVPLNTRGPSQMIDFVFTYLTIKFRVFPVFLYFYVTKAICSYFYNKSCLLWFWLWSSLMHNTDKMYDVQYTYQRKRASARELFWK